MFSGHRYQKTQFVDRREGDSSAAQRVPGRSLALHTDNRLRGIRAEQARLESSERSDARMSAAVALMSLRSDPDLEAAGILVRMRADPGETIITDVSEGKKRAGGQSKRSGEEHRAARRVAQSNRRARQATSKSPGGAAYEPLRPFTLDKVYTAADDSVIAACHAQYAACNSGRRIPEEILTEWFNARVGPRQQRTWPSLASRISKKLALRNMRKQYGH